MPPGQDGITNKMLKELPRKGKVALTGIVNVIIRREHKTICWKHAEAIMLSKAGKSLKIPQNYRPINKLATCTEQSSRESHKNDT